MAIFICHSCHGNTTHMILAYLINNLWSGFLNTVMETVCALGGSKVVIFFLFPPLALSRVPPDSINAARPSSNDVITLRERAQ